MKRIKKLASLLLAMIMVLAMTMTAFAAKDDGSTPTDGGNNESTTLTEKSGEYNIYQIFTGDYSEGVLSNVRWGVNGTGYSYKTDEDGNLIQPLEPLDPQPLVDTSILKELEATYRTTDNSGNNFTVDDVAQLEVIRKYAKLENPIISKGTETTYTTYKIGDEEKNLEPGYYLVSGTVTYSDDTSKAETLYVVRVVNDTLTFAPKVGVPTVDKKIAEGANRVDANGKSIGDVVNYEIVGTMPSNINVYKEYTYLFTDTLSKGLTFNNDIKVEVDGVDVTKYFWKNITPEEQSEETPVATTIKVGMQDIKSLSGLYNVEITKDTKVVVTYSATLNQAAEIAGAGNKNDVILNYSNNPNNSGEGNEEPPENPEEPTTPSGVTPKKEVVTFTTELTILKTNQDEAFLPGVEFTLTGNGVNVVLVTTETFVEAADGEYWKLMDDTYTTTAPITAEGDTNNEAAYVPPVDGVYTKYAKVTNVTAKGTGQGTTGEDGTKAYVDVVGTVQADGTVTFKGLGAGDYTITETKTLPGYNTIEPINFTLTFLHTETTTDSDGNEVVNVVNKFVSSNDKVTVGEDNMLDTSIVNQRGSLLPSTGGIGTTIFYVVGSILVIGAGILLVAKKRMSANK